MRRFNTNLIGLISFITFLIIWESLVKFGLADPFFFSSPSRIATAGYDLFATGFIYKHLWISAQEFFWGFSLAVLVGIALGLVIGSSRFFYDLLHPFLLAFYNTPRIILLPLFVLWFGIGIFSKILAVFVGAVFPILINTLTAAQNVDPALIRMAHSFNVSQRRIFWTITLPFALPYILSGIELAVGRGLIGVLIGELYGSQGGLGYLASYYGALLQIDKLMFVIFLFILWALGMTQIFRFIIEKFEYWRLKGPY